MKLECEQLKIKDVVGLAEKISGKHMTLPVLSCLILDASKKDSLVIKSTNLDLGIEIKIPAKVEKEGIVAVPSNIFSSFVSNISGESTLKLEIKDNTLFVSNKTNSGIIKTVPADDFPSIPKITNGNKFTIGTQELIRGLKSVWYSSSISNIKPELSSVYIYSEDEFVVFVATDSFRLAEKRVKVKKSKDFGYILIPHKNIPDIIRVFENQDGEINVTLDKNQISLECNNIFMVSRVIDGVFPDYKQIIPKKSTTDVTLLKQDLINALKLSNVFSDKFNQFNVKVFPSSKKVEVKTKNNDVGENISYVDAVIEGEDIDINFNHKYFVDCFQSIDSDSVVLKFNGLNRPMIVIPLSDNTFRYLVMPMNR